MNAYCFDRIQTRVESDALDREFASTDTPLACVRKILCR